jgi:hypothetical protein
VRLEWRIGFAALAALLVGALFARPYARLATPYYTAVDRWIAASHPWQVDEVVVTDMQDHGAILRLTGEVRRRRSDARPAAKVVGRVSVGEAIETPLVFWTLLAVWPAVTSRERWVRLAWGIPVFLLLEAVTTGVQLVHSMAEVSAILGGDENPMTAWEVWSRFLEAGGQFALVAAAAAATVAVSAPRRARLADLREAAR